MDYEIDRSRLKLEDILGEGQFGDVFKGLYTDLVCLLFYCIFNLWPYIFFSLADLWISGYYAISIQKRELYWSREVKPEVRLSHACKITKTSSVISFSQNYSISMTFMSSGFTTQAVNNQYIKSYAINNLH